MRKITLLFSCLMIPFLSVAQLPSQAPDFSVQDINGNTHTLSEYLNAGKTVIIDFSATWCGPCWNYHNNHYLEDLYYSYGPGGSDEIVVLFIEGDAMTTLDDLHGTGTNTQGNWVEGSPYPIIDGAAIADLYQIEYFPTVIRVCPSGAVTEIGTAGPNTVRNGIVANCGVTFNGTENNVHPLTTSNRFCGASGAPSIKIRNYGDNQITSANINLLENGNVIASKAFSGTMNRFITRTVVFDELTLDHNAEYEFELVDVNNSPLFAPEHNKASGISFAQESGTSAIVNVYTDNYPSEISWAIKNGAGAVVASGGPYSGSANGGGPNANTVKTHDVTLPEGECLTVELYDAYGDGWSLGPTAHGFEIVSDGVPVFYQPVGNFGVIQTISAAASTLALHVGEAQAQTFTVYPNPTSGILNIISQSDVDVEVSNMLGKIVYKGNSVASGSQIDLTGIEKGMYFAKISDSHGSSIEKIIIK